MDDFLSKKRDSGTVLDLSKATADTKEEFRKLFDKVPDFKIKPEKVRPEDIKIRENAKKFGFKTGKKDYKLLKETYLFGDPVPPEMRTLKIGELAAVPIDWKMLTSIRPKSKVDEDFFSRLVELKKLEQKTEARDKRVLAMDPQVRKIKNKAGVVEFRPVNCVDCGEDFCNGKLCTQLTYDCFTRLPEAPPKASTKAISLDFGEKKSRKKKKRQGGKRRERKSRSPRKGKSKKRTKSKSPRKVKKHN